MKTTDSEYFNPAVPKPRSFSQTTAAPKMGGGSTVQSVSSGTTRADPRSKSKGMGPLSVPRSGCCGRG